MKKQVQPNRWSCLPTSFAIILGVDVQRIFDYLGHDGSEIVFPDYPEPQCRRSFHAQEMTRYCLDAGATPIWIEVYPQSSVSIDLHFVDLMVALDSQNIRRAIDTMKIINRSVYSLPETDEKWMEQLLIKASGVLVGTTQNGRLHAVAWDGPTIYDPNGTEYSSSEFLVREFCILK